MLLLLDPPQVIRATPLVAAGPHHSTVAPSPHALTIGPR